MNIILISMYTLHMGSRWHAPDFYVVAIDM